jgi:guanyl-specific ribonuclease Sa
MRVRIIIALAALLLPAGSAIAQINSSSENANVGATVSANTSEDASAPSTTSAKPQEKAKSKCAPGKIQHLRPTNQCGIYMFEPPKDEG